MKNKLSMDEYMKKLNEEKELDDSGKHIYPLTIIKDRYTGSYSGGKFTAWNLDFDEVPGDIESSDIPCSTFWGENERDEKYVVGLGKTPNKSLKDLCFKLKKKGLYKPN